MLGKAIGGRSVIDAIRAKIREVPDFPKPGILFYDITTVLGDATLFRACIDLMTEPFQSSRIDVVVAMESRGFIFGAPLAERLGVGFAPIRKLSKLPWRTVSREYMLEYGTNTLEMHADAVCPGQRVLLVDDLLATGGTLAASLDIVQELGGIPVAVAVLVELTALGGREFLSRYEVDVMSLLCM